MVQVVLITGGHNGIGRSVALAFTREGADIVISYLHEDLDAKTIVQDIMDSGRSAFAIPGIISDPSHVSCVVDTTVDLFGRIDNLVNNAATRQRD